MPWPKMISPEESIRTPTKNQMESACSVLGSTWWGCGASGCEVICVSLSGLPEPEVENKQNGGHHGRPEDGFLEDVGRPIVRDHGRSVDQPGELRLRCRLGHVADHNRDDDAYDPRPQRAVEIGSHGLHAQEIGRAS